jgi:hypothetical protein
MAALQKTMEVIAYQCWYYETACEAGTEDAPRNMHIDELPEYARKGKAALERTLSE